MNFRYSFVAGTIGAFALVVGGMTADLHAQRGGGAGVGRGRPETAGQGRPAPAGQPDGPGRPATPPTKPDRPDKPVKPDHPEQPAKPDRPATDARSGKPTVSDQVVRNAGLTTQLKGLFPAGTDLQKASDGFKNLGQFVAAAHVSHNNPDIPFDALKAKMTGDNAESLGKAIHELKPTADANAEAKKAEKEADADIKASGRGKSSDAS